VVDRSWCRADVNWGRHVPEACFLAVQAEVELSCNGGTAENSDVFGMFRLCIV